MAEGFPGELLRPPHEYKKIRCDGKYMQEIDGVYFLVHCCHDVDYVIEIMSLHGTLEENQDHQIWQKVDGEWKPFHFAEPFSHHNKGMYWVDDISQCHHAPISLESVWATKCWPNHQFTFLLSVAEVNAGMAWARGWREPPAQLMIDFWRHLIMRRCSPTN